MRFRLRREKSGFDEYINIYDERNKLVYYSVEVDYMRPKRLLYTKAQERVSTVDFAPMQEDILRGFPIYFGTKKIGFYDDTVMMDSMNNVEFAHVVGPELHFIERSERLTFLEYMLCDDNGGVMMKIKRSGTDFVCDIAQREDVIMCLTLATVEYWRYVTTTRDY